MVVGVNDLTDNIEETYSEIKVFFDASTNKIRLNNSQIRAKVEVFSILGNKMISASVVDNLDVSNLQSGIYVVRVNGSIALKFIKN